jgi:plasmid maintenance system killer protein
MNDKIKHELLIRRFKNKKIDKSILSRRKSREITAHFNRPKINKVNIRKLLNNQKRMFSPEEQRHHILSTKDNSIASRIVNGKYSRKLASPVINNIRLNSISPANTANQSHIAKLKERIMLRNNAHMNSISRDKTNDSTNKSPHSISPISTIGRHNWNGIKGHHNALSPKSISDNMSINSHVVKTFSSEDKKKGYKQIDGDQIEEDVADIEFRNDLFVNLTIKDYENESENKLRENLI